MTLPGVPRAARAVIEAALDEAQLAGLRTPATLAEAVAAALADAGWTCTPRTPVRAPQTAA